MYKEIVDHIRSIFHPEEFIPLHVPTFGGNEKKYLEACIDTTFVSSVGEFVDQFEIKLAEKLGAKKVIAVVNGSCALHLCLHSLKVKDCEVITQALSFVSTANSIIHAGASPIFIDVDQKTLGMSPKSLKDFLKASAIIENNSCINRKTGKRIAACLPMHTFGHPCEIDEIASICEEWKIDLVEDAAEAIGSSYKNKSCGTYGRMGVFSFNGNKTITSGGGGAIATDDEDLAKQLKHLSTQAKVAHPWEFSHDYVGFNFRMPNLNAALALAQLEQLDDFISQKRRLAAKYHKLFANLDIKTVKEIEGAFSNYWLNALIFNSQEEKNEFLKYSNEQGVMTRPVWQLLNTLKMFKEFQTDNLESSIYLSERLVNIPSSVSKF